MKLEDFNKLYDVLRDMGYVGLLTVKEERGCVTSCWIGKPGGDDKNIEVLISSYDRKVPGE